MVQLVAIYVTCGTCCLLWDSSQSRSCRYIRHLQHMLPILGFIAKQILSLYTSLAAHVAYSGIHRKADLVAIYVTCGTCCLSWDSSQSRSCRYIRHLRHMLPILGFIAQQILSLYTSLAAHVAYPGIHRKADLVAIYVTCGTCFWDSSQSRSCRYIRHLRHMLPILGFIAQQILSLYTSLAAHVAYPGIHRKADLVAIYVTCGTCGLSWDSSQSRSCRYIRHLRHMLPILGFIAKQILSLYTSLAAHVAYPGIHCKADLVAICSTCGTCGL